MMKEQLKKDLQAEGQDNKTIAEIFQALSDKQVRISRTNNYRTGQQRYDPDIEAENEELRRKGAHTH